jgi:hypothetical protein
MNSSVAKIIEHGSFAGCPQIGGGCLALTPMTDLDFIIFSSVG